MNSLSVVLPAYNEAENIEGMVADVIRTVSARCRDYEVIVVTDGSRDGTPAKVAALAAAHPQVRLVKHEVNLGYGAAVFDGLASAAKEWVFLTDSDRQFDLGEIDHLIAVADQADLVIGYRAPRRDPFVRTLNGMGWSLCVTLLFGYTGRDVDCAFKLIRRSVIAQIKGKVRSRGATFSAEFLVRAKRAGFRMREVPIRGHRPRLAGKPSGGRLDVIVRAFTELFKFRLSLWRGGKSA